MDKIPRVKNKGVFYKAYSNLDGLRLNLIPEQNNMSCKMYLVVKFPKMGDLVVNFIYGTGYVSIAWLLLLKHHLLVGFYLYSACIDYYM